MNYWELRQDDTALVGYSPDGDLVDAIQREGINPAAARAALLSGSGRGLALQRLAPDGDTIISEAGAAMPDFLSWSWIPIFSAQGRALCLRHGSIEADFLPCAFEFRSDPYFVHLPLGAEDIVDVARSQFLMTIPSVPPLPFHIEALALRTASRSDIFRAAIPGHVQVFSELFVSDKFKRDWEAGALRGAAFRPLHAAPSPEQLQRA